METAIAVDAPGGTAGRQSTRGIRASSFPLVNAYAEKNGEAFQKFTDVFRSVLLLYQGDGPAC